MASQLTRSRLAALCAALLPGLALAALPATATAVGGQKMTPPRAIHVVRVSSSSFTVRARGSAKAKRYQLWASTTRSDLYVRNLGRAKTVSSKHPTLTVRGLPYTSKPYYYRLAAWNGPHHQFSPLINAVGLRPAVPSRVDVGDRDGGLALSWHSGPATGFSVEQATDPSMSQHVQRYRLRGKDTTFTPYGVAPGTTYYFRIRALNGSTPSGYTSPIGATDTASGQAVRVMTYNVLEAYYDGRREGSGHVSPWSQRVHGVVKLIRQADPDVIAIQEAAAWTAGVKGPRQVDSLVHHLGGTYALAHTEIPPTQHHYFRTGVYVLYKKADYKAVGAGNHWGIGDNRWAAYQTLENRTSGARFLFVSPHLSVGAGLKYDKQREAETQSLLRQADAYAAHDNLPIVFGGDFNSDNDHWHPLNAPAKVMRQARVDDAFDVAQRRTNARFNSANDYYRKPPAFGYHLDYIYVSPGIAVRSWKLIIDLRHGRFVGVIPSDHNPIVANIVIPYRS
ncbi:MAG TPA: endonuclease/exonuclease/phosphatase family protein [Mycobacteriales bacterium]|nr:endonuclease/exonuclease/phosphatase family protein [Mycobacteriales bacterium]